MHLPAPRSLDEIITDGAFIAAGVDHALAQRYGRIHSVDLHVGSVVLASRLRSGEPDVMAEARIVSEAGEFPAQVQRIALIRDGRWQWTTRLVEGLEVTELHDPGAPVDRLRLAARTVTGGKPVLVLPMDNSARAVVALAAPHGPLDPRRAIADGVRRFAGHIDEERAVLAYATAGGLGIARKTRAAAVDIELAGSTVVTLAAGSHRGAPRVTEVSGGLAAGDVLADASYTAVEHRMLFEGRYPGAAVSVDLDAGKARVASDAGAFEARAHMIATVTGGTWTWAWADAHLRGKAIAQASLGLARCGADNGLIDLVRPTMPAAWAREHSLGMMAMPILGVWTLVTVRLNELTTGVMLIEARELDLPVPTPEAVQAVLSTPLPEGVPRERALRAYAHNRSLRSNAARVYFPDGTAVTTDPVVIERP